MIHTFNNQIVRTCKIPVSQHVRAIGIHVIEEYVIIINQENHIRHYKHPLSNEDMPNAANWTSCSCGLTGSNQYDYGTPRQRHLL